MSQFMNFVQKINLTGKVFVFFTLFMVAITACAAPVENSRSDIQLVQSWTLENCEAGLQVDGAYYDISVWENRQSDSVANIQAEERLLGSNDIVLDSKNMEMQITPLGMVVNMVSLNSNGSKVQSVKRSINSTYFAKTSIEGQDKIDVKPFFKKGESNNIVLGLDIDNKSDFGLVASTKPVALVVNDRNEVVDILNGEIEGNTLEI